MTTKQLCIVSAPVDTHSGYGARARDFVRSLIRIKPEWDVKILPQRWGGTPFGALDPLISDDQDLLNRFVRPDQIVRQPEIWIQITVPNEMQPNGKFNILVTAGTESDPCSAEFVEGVNRADLTLVSSEFTKTIFMKSQYDKVDKNTQQKVDTLQVTKPIEVVHEGLNPVYKRQDGSTFDLDDINESFCFITVGHWLNGDINAYADRKGISLAVKVFLETFKNTKNPPALILKSSCGNYSYTDQEQILSRIDTVRKTVNAKTLPNIYLFHGHIQDEDFNELYNHEKVKAFFLPTRGEGYGRPYLEFSAVGKPVIASNYSGHTDFLHTDFTVYVGGKIEPVHPSVEMGNIITKESHWFSPDPNQCAQALMAVYSNYDHYQVLGRKQGFRSRTEFSMEKMDEKLKAVLDQYVPKFSVPVPIKLPSLKKMSVPEDIQEVK